MKRYRRAIDSVMRISRSETGRTHARAFAGIAMTPVAPVISVTLPATPGMKTALALNPSKPAKGGTAEPAVKAPRKRAATTRKKP